MKSCYIDQIGHEIILEKTPQRIISLVPSQTELLFDLGLKDKIVGITKFCIHPKTECKGIEKIGGTKKFDFEKIAALQPDLIIGNKEENYQEGIQQLQQKYPVWTSDIYSLNDAYQMMLAIGNLTKMTSKAKNLVQNIKTEFQVLQSKKNTQKVLYLIWKKPYMAAGKNTFINEMLKICGFENCITESRYPIISEAEIKELSPNLIFLSSEPYPFKETHFEELQRVSPTSKIKLVDGELFSWYGSRLQHAAKYFRTIHL